MKTGSGARPHSPSVPGLAHAADTSPPALPVAGLARRLGALLYEALLLVAMAFVVGFLFLPLVSPSAARDAALSVPPLFARAMLFCALVAGAAVYYAWCWSDGRRTLPQKTWRLRLVVPGGGRVTWRRALARYAAGWIGPALAMAGYAALRPFGHAPEAIALFALNYAFALVDRDRQFLHDRIAGTRLILSR
ncbi:MAG: RDD family protein [Rudaea sp.]